MTSPVLNPRRSTRSALPSTVDAFFRGGAWRPGEAGYDDARRNWHAVDSRPALVVEALDEQDVVAAVRVAADHGLALAVQNTGHGNFAAADGGLLLRVSRLRGLSVDPRTRRARLGAGGLLRTVLAAAAPYGLTPLSGSTPWLGAAGFTLGGGVGWLTRSRGYAADSLAAARVVTGTGRVARVDATHEPELLWGLRGAGGSLGVVTELELDLHPVPHLYGGTIAFPAPDPLALLTWYREWTNQVPDELSTALVLRPVPPEAQATVPWVGSTPVLAALRVMSQTTRAVAEHHLAPLRAFVGPTGLDTVRPIDPGWRARVGPPTASSPRAGAQELFDQLPDSVLARLAATVLDPSTPVALAELRHWGGAIRRSSESASPAGPRAVDFGLSIEFNSPRGGDIGDGESDARQDEVAAQLRIDGTGRAVRTLLTDAARTDRAYAPVNHARLVELKRACDPHDLLRVGHGIPLDGWPALPMSTSTVESAA
jgi:hypothetical protein